MALADICLIVFVHRHVTLHGDWGYYEGLYGFGGQAVLVCVGMTILSFASLVVALAAARTRHRWWLLLLLPVLAWAGLCCNWMMGFQGWAFLYHICWPRR
jgi:hypothetical protein